MNRMKFNHSSKFLAVFAFFAVHRNSANSYNVLVIYFDCYTFESY